jgi:hypothetical protein
MEPAQSSEVTEPKKIEILLQEYSTLRQEIIGRTSHGFQLVTVGAVLWIWASTTKSGETVYKPAICFAFVAFFFAIGATLKGTSAAVKRVREIESDINRRAGEELLIWESKRGGGGKGIFGFVMRVFGLRNATSSPKTVESPDYREKRVPSDSRYPRWQASAMGQFTLAIALISTLSVSAMGAGLSCLRDDKFVPLGWWKCAFSSALLLFVFATLLCLAAVISRWLDFRLTARKVRKSQNSDYNKSLTILGCGPDEFGELSKGIFWYGLISFLLGTLLLVLCVASVYGDKLL